MVGAGLALGSAGGCVESRALYGIPVPDGQVSDGKVSADKTVRNDFSPVYMAPDKGSVDAAKVDLSPKVDYMAPDASVDLPPTPPYMAPDVGPKKDKGPDGSGPNPLYMASMPKERPSQS